MISNEYIEGRVVLLVCLLVSVVYAVACTGQAFYGMKHSCMDKEFQLLLLHRLYDLLIWIATDTDTCTVYSNFMVHE